ncbi:MAG: hypothetical protein K0R67_555 [Paenibacillus sp.]|nr:hypothetical protein [Paenibacillus sp.]
MNNKFKTLVPALLVFSLALSACSSGKSNETAPNGAANASSSPSPSAAKKERLPVKMFISSLNASSVLPTDASKDFVKKAIEEKFNVDLAVEYMFPGNDYNTKINTLIAGNNIPDVWRDATGDGGLKFALDGLLADMTTFVTPQTMPNYFKYWVKEEELARYRINNQYVRAPLPFNRNIYRTYYIRKDWLDKLGLKIPQTYDEYVNVLRAFTNDDPDGDGKKNTYGFSLSGNGTAIGLDWPEYIKNGLTLALFVENNQFIDMQSDIRVQQVVEDIMKVTKEGLVDPDYFLNKGVQHVDKATQGKVGIVLGGTKDFAYDSNPQSLQTRSKAINQQADWVPFTPLGKTPLQTATLPGSPFLFSKVAAEKSPEKVKRIVEILDWLASEEGFLLTHYGIEGKHYTKNGNTITLNNAAYDADIVKQGNFLDIWSFFTPSSPEVLGLKLIDPRETERDRSIETFIRSIPTRASVGTNLVPPPGVDLAAFRTRMNELIVKMMFDDKSAAKWPEYREELLNKYNGKKMFDAYTEQIKAAGIIK